MSHHERTSRTIGVALALLVTVDRGRGGRPGAVLLRGPRSPARPRDAETTVPEAAARPRRRPSAVDEARRRGHQTRPGRDHDARPRAPDRGQPVIWLRHGARIPIRTRSRRRGGRQDARRRTEFGSPHRARVFRQQRSLGRRADRRCCRNGQPRLGEARSREARARAGRRYSIDVDLSSRAARASPRRSGLALVPGHGRRARHQHPDGALRGHRHLPRQPRTRPTAAARSRSPRPAEPAVRLARRRPDRDPRHHRAARRRRLARLPAGRERRTSTRSSTGSRSGRRWSSGSSSADVCSASAASRSPRHLVDVGEHVAVADEPEEDAAVVADDADRQRVALRRERHERVDLDASGGPAGRTASAGRGRWRRPGSRSAAGPSTSASTRLIVGGVQPVASITSEAARACSDSFSRAVSSWTRSSRAHRVAPRPAAAATISVAIRLPSSSCSSGRRMLIGTRATSCSGTGSPRRSKKRRSPPAATERITSLTVAPLSPRAPLQRVELGRARRRPGGRGRSPG